MHLVTQAFVFLLGIYFSNAEDGYELKNPGETQSDVQAPVYVPPYAKNFNIKTYKGPNTVYAGRKTMYAGTKNGRPGTKTGHGTKSTYGERKIWYSGSGAAPTYQEFHGNAIGPYQPKCEVECKNNGICVETNTCRCQPNFEGKYCEFEKKPCIVYPPMPMNSNRKCSSEMCTITCIEGHKFFDGSTVANMRCVSGQWKPTRADLTSISDCQPECEPRCLNGGVCLAVNTCQCPTEYTGPQCQYSTSACDIRKLAFNGGYRCFMDGETYSCRLECPTGASFSSPAAELYTCHFSTGEFEPKPIPHCVFDEVIVITPSNHHHNDVYYSLHKNDTASSSSTTEQTTLVPGKYGGPDHPMTIVVQDFTPKGGSCLTWAGVHYKTFDGKIYSFESPCTHVLAREAGEHGYTLAARRPACARDAYCPLHLSIYLDDKAYMLSVAEDGSVIFKSTKRLIPIPAFLPGIRVTMPSDHVIVALDGFGVTIKWDTNDIVVIEGSVLLWNKTEGLCGTLDGNPENDMRIKDGSIARTQSVMIASWQMNKVGEMCDSTPTETSSCMSKTDSDVQRAAQFCAKIFTKEKFRKCSKVMDVSQLLEACQWDYCACTTSMSPEDCACSTVSVYAKECLRHGVEEMKSWRDADTCPMKCPDGKVYRSCGPDVQPSCAFPLDIGKNSSSCVEGCFCPEGLLQEGGRCIQKSECPCRSRKQTFPPGSVIRKNCNTCTCEGGEWVCTTVPCGARCGAVGDPHYTTFDGLRYDFMGHCTYTLLSSGNLTIEVENVACSGTISEAMNLTPYKGEGKPSCTKAVNLIYNNANIHLKQGGFILVNGKEVATLPVNIGDIKIRAASSLFIIIQLPIQVDLWWDGNTRVFVDVPPTFVDNTKGLCGTFNQNQKDDFLTPEGDVEQSALAFANKWKTREFCSDVATVEPEHPCHANPENKEAAEAYCSKLKSNLFDSCHWFVDVQAYYEACVYDMCACAGDAARCLCPLLGDYASACAQAGVLVQWRYHVSECELSCTGGQQYTVCADSCLRTCADVSLAPTAACRPQCVEGCACPVGQVLDANNMCVPVGLCPCYHKGMQFNAGYKEIRAGKREQELCTCVGAHWDCLPATPDDIKNFPPAEDLRANCSAANNMEFTTCQIAEPLTCKNMHLPPSATTQECRPGCQCSRGFVLDTGSSRCVRAADCPCHHGGRSYPDGHVMQEECNTCECKSGKWACSARPCEGECGAWGDSHVRTFDGAEYSFEGVCGYLLAKGCVDSKDGFAVEIQNEPCGTTGATCSKSVTLRVGNGGADEESVSLTKTVPLPDLSGLKRIKLRLAGAFVFLDVPSLGMSLQWDRGMQVYVRVDTMWQNRVKGLCGNYNSDTRDDFQTPGGGGLAETSALIFADSWKLKPTCPKPQEVTEHCAERPQRREWARRACGALKRAPFSACHAEVAPGAAAARCERDACACDAGADCECACAALAAYAHACARRGVTFKWRSQDLCPMQCDEECSSYSECMSPCPPETCDNTLDYKEIKAVCEQDTCVEGCKPNKICPEGTVYANSSSTECVPRAKCKPVCMTLPDGKEILEGEIIEEDACHTCRCSKKTRVCNGQPCPTDVPVPDASTAPPETTPHDRPLGCAPGWTAWLSRARPERGALARSEELEPLPAPNQLEIGSPMCDKDMMTQVECRTVDDHKTPKETGLNVECSLENGLICRENNDTCPDFEIRVYCNCAEEPFQCLDAEHPSHPHPHDCAKFYECTPDSRGERPHAVLKSCPEGLLYHPRLMVCDWPASVAAARPACGATTPAGTAPGLTETTPPEIWPGHSESTTVTILGTSPTTSAPTSTSTAGTTVSQCPPGQVFEECAFPCDKLCEHFRHTLQAEYKCTRGQKCASGCIDKAVANIKCDFGSRWRDEKTCVLLSDCTCDSLGEIVKPGGVVTNGCTKCQCLDNQLHCDSSQCYTYTITEPPHLPLKSSSLPPVSSTGPSTVYTTGPTQDNTFPGTYSSSPVESSTTISTNYTHIPTTYTPSFVTNYTAPSSTTSPSTTPTVPTTPTTPAVPTTIIVPNTGTPPPECNPDGYKNLLWDREIPLEDSAFSASSVSNELFEPQFAVLNGHSMDLTAGSWSPSIQDQNQYIQVELPQKEPIYGVLLQGSPVYDHYVTSYELMYGDDGNAFSYVEGPDGNPKVFRGPMDHENAMKQMISPPVEARVVRLRPLTWHDEIAVRLELIGCQQPLTTSPATTPTTPTTSTTPTTTLLTTVEAMQCTEELGLGAELPLESIEVSSNNDARPQLRLAAPRGWRPLYSTPGEWIMFNFTSPRNLTGVKTKGGENGWVSAYNVMFTSDLSTFNPVVDSAGNAKVFPGNFDADTVVLNEFRPPIRAQYLKVLPIKWDKNIEMRVEPIGCFEPYPVTEGPVASTPPSQPPCELCPGALVADEVCACAAGLYYDGENCVSRDQCPCIMGITAYPVGSSFRGFDCDECVCKLGGLTQCKPLEPCACEPDLVPKLSPDCTCSCAPCAAGSRICPTSKLCLPAGRWCDGLQDCPDDERDCATTTLAPVTETVVTTVAPTVAATRPTTPTTLTTLPATTTVAPKTCPKVECPPGYTVKIITGASSHSHSSTSDLPPPRPRFSYQRYYRGAKGGRGGFSKGGFSKGGFSKGGFSKGGFSRGPQTPPQQNQAFSLEKPAVNASSGVESEECTQFKCIPKLPPPYKPGATPPPEECSTPVCPPRYSLKLEVLEGDNCPQYSCVPPVERPVFCNVTGRTFNTFDGAEFKLDLCFHMLARENRFNSWSIMVRKKCRLEGCRNELLVNQDSEVILVRPNFMIEYDNFEYTVEQTSKICFQKNSFDVGRLGNGLYIKSRRYNFTVLYNQDGDVKIGVSKSYMGQVDGLCGPFDGEWRNDRSLPSGRAARSLDELARAWLKPGLPPSACKTKSIDPIKQKRVWDLCNVITQEPLSHCASVLNLKKWRSICLEKICECSELVINGTKMGERACRCLLLEQMVAECLAADKDITVDAWRTQMDCPAECPAPLVHYDCYRKRCEPACGAGGADGAERSCPAADGQCFPGCYCPEGKLRKGDACVLPADCLDCACTGVGAPAKYATFEGDELPFLGNCTYLASRDRNETGQHKYQVYATNGPCEESTTSICTKSVHLIYEKNVVRIEKDEETKKLITTINGHPVFKYPTKNEWALITLDKGQDITVMLPDLHVELRVLQSKMQFGVRVPSSQYGNRTEGLCGVCAGTQPQLLASNGTYTDDFELYGKSWQATPETLKLLEVPPQEQCGEVPPPPPCVPPPPESNPCYNINNVDKFGACHALVEPAEHVARCEAELCELNSTDACPLLERYAADCRRLGVCLNWRTDLCPYPCEEPLVYRPCMDCERTCENHDELEADPKKCDKPSAEGCFCPEGKVRVNNTCIEPTKCFPCDANKEHYAGDEWQEDACNKCACSKLPGENAAHVACTTHVCAAPVCAQHEDTVSAPARPGACCPEYACVPKPENKTKCEEPKKMECGFGQVLKQKTTPNGCKEFACECKPASECERIPDDSEVDLMEPGVARVVDASGCCPRAQLLCRPHTCPRPPPCPQFHTLDTSNVTGKCCPEYKCELPKDQCVVELEWEAAPRGGEKARATPEVVLKELDAVWLDGPCRSCRCAAGGRGAAPRPQCRVTECPLIASDAQFVLEPHPVPFQCCPEPLYVACRDADNIYKVGENWTSSENVCESYLCSQLEDGKLEKVTKVQSCDIECQPGWEYTPAAPGSGKCCGKCAPVACVVGDQQRAIGESWTSPDFCTNYTCVLLNGSLQVQSSDETCPEVSEATLKQFVMSDEKIPGKCCPKREPVACRVGTEIYQEGQSWTSPDPCKNYTCSRSEAGLGHAASSRSCDTSCQPGYGYRPPAAGACCGDCVPTACLVDGELVEPGKEWSSADNCTKFACTNSSGTMLVTSARDLCPDVSACAPEDLVNETCCQVCKEKPSDLSTCAPVAVAQSARLVRVWLGARGLCVNPEPVRGLRECRGACATPTEYNMHTGALESACECCQAARYEGVLVPLRCADGSRPAHRVASAAACACNRCAAPAFPPWATPTSYSAYPHRYKHARTRGQSDEISFPDFDVRYGTTPVY